MTKPRGGKGIKVLYVKSRQGHLRTKKTTRMKNRTLKSHTVSKTDRTRVTKLITS
ncbi:MAG: hypothetical protein PHG63_02300 [Candidatus Dojkabacteria bacterium]|nr:hypothetical protein [Candidatus Dojkabacteria bacterium]